MSCSPLLALARECGADGIIAGIEKLYMIAFNDLKPVAGSLTNEVYTISTGGLVNEIGVVTGRQFVEIAVGQNTSGINSEMTKEPANGVLFFTNTMPLVLPGLSTENATFFDNVLNQPVVAIVKTKTGKYFVTGLNGSFESSASSTGTGVANNDLQGFNVTFTGVDTKRLLQVDPTIIADLLEPAA